MANQYMRKWRINVYKRDSEDKSNDLALDLSELRCVFKTDAKIETCASVCTLQLYNVSIVTESEIIREGFQISIEAGYQSGQYGTIFEGDIVQVIRNRENGTDYKLEILALRGSAMFDMNFSRCSIAAQSTPRDIMKAVGESAIEPIVVGEISENISDQKLARGKVIFGEPKKYFRDISIGNDAYFWPDEENKLTVKTFLDEIPADQVLELTPDTGLVGTPQYTDNGINIKMLMDSRVKLFSLIKIDNEIIQRQLVNLNLNSKGQNQLPQQSQFDQDGEYQVSAVSHHGDTHGNDWVTEVVGVGRHGRTGLITAQDHAGQSTH